MWYVMKQKTNDAGLHVDTVLGRCRKRAPTMAGYPAVFLDDWCGEHKLCEDCCGEDWGEDCCDDICEDACEDCKPSETTQ